MSRIGLVQLSVSDNPTENLETTTQLICKCSEDGATHIFTPEATNLICTDRARQAQILQTEEDDLTLNALRALSKELGIWIHIGSLALTGGEGGKFLNRGFVISPDGHIKARYDKIHLFDVAVTAADTYQESSAYYAGDQAVVAQMGAINLGLSICYDLRFPHLYRGLALAGASVLTVPGAFSTATGPDHIEVLLKARAIETGCFVVMAAQTGQHKQAVGKPRATWGHSMVIDPWGRMLCDLGTDIGWACLDIDLSLVEKTRTKIPSLHHNPAFKKP
ncbi:MAG: carbon-nitrogen hydrolase family protein [Pseudomonadota bacterium]